MPRRSGATRRLVRPGTAIVGVLLAGALAGCGEEEAEPRSQPVPGTMTGCLREAGYALERRSSTTLDVRRPGTKAQGAYATVIRTSSEKNAADLTANTPEGKGAAIGTRIVVYRGDVDEQTQRDVERCATQHPDSTPPEV